MMTDRKHFVQLNAVAGWAISGSNLTPESLTLRQARRAAAGFNIQRMALTGARVWRPHCRVMLSRGASIPSGVEPARRRFVKALSYANCFFRRLLASSTYAGFPNLGHSRRGLPPSGNRPMMTDRKHFVQLNAVAGWAISGSNLTPESLTLRQARRKAAGFNKSPEPTAVGAGSSAIAVHVASRRWLSF